MGLLKRLYVQVLIGVALGIAVGAFFPETGAALKPLGDAFIRLIKMLIAPIVFCTVASGVAHMSDMRTFGRVGVKTLVYFEVVSTLALLVGLAVALVLRPGAGFDIDPAELDPAAAAGYVARAGELSVTDHLLGIIPESFLAAFVNGELLQVLLVAILTGFACTRLGAFGNRVAGGLDGVVKVFFAILSLVVRLAPIGAFGAMAFTVGRYGLDSLIQLGALIGCFYATALVFVLVVLGGIARVAGFSILRFIAYIREELLIVLGTSSSETVLPQIMAKLERLGVDRTVVGLVIPTGYSFNLDGTNIYMTLAALFLAQATGTELSAVQIATLLGVAMLTSKGASGVTGAGFVTLAATLAVVPDIPLASLAILVGVDRFMSECRALTNLVGNGVATVVIGRWEGRVDRGALARELAAGPSTERVPPLETARP